jgi:hypothetical protein
VLQDLMFHRDEGQRTGPALFFLNGEHAAALGGGLTAAQRPVGADAAACPHPATAAPGESSDRPAQRVPVRAEVGLRRAVEQVEPVPKQRQPLAPREVRHWHAKQRAQRAGRSRQQWFGALA